MSGRGIDFLENWVNKNVTPADRKGSHGHAKEPEWGRVEEIIYDAMQDVLGDELVFWKTVAAIRDRRKKETVH